MGAWVIVPVAVGSLAFSEKPRRHARSPLHGLANALDFDDVNSDGLNHYRRQTFRLPIPTLE